MFFPVLVDEKPSCGLIFAAKTLPSSSTWTNIRNSGETLVAVSQSGAGTPNFAYSTDGGETWTAATTTGMTAGGYTGLAHNGSVFFSAVSGFALGGTTADGITWTNRTVPAATHDLMGITAGNGLFVFLQNITSRTFFTSSDGASWVTQTDILPVAARWNSVAFGAGLFVAVSGYPGAATDVYATSNGSPITSWTQRQLPVSDVWRPIVWNGRVFVIAAQGSRNILTSPDGLPPWTALLFPVGATYNWASLQANTVGALVASATNLDTGVYCSNDDAVSWTLKDLTSTGIWQGIGTNGFRFAIAKQASTILNATQA